MCQYAVRMNRGRVVARLPKACAKIDQSFKCNSVLYLLSRWWQECQVKETYRHTYIQIICCVKSTSVSMSFLLTPTLARLIACVFCSSVNPKCLPVGHLAMILKAFMLITVLWAFLVPHAKFKYQRAVWPNLLIQEHVNLTIRIPMVYMAWRIVKNCGCMNFKMRGRYAPQQFTLNPLNQPIGKGGGV